MWRSLFLLIHHSSKRPFQDDLFTVGILYTCLWSYANTIPLSLIRWQGDERLLKCSTLTSTHSGGWTSTVVMGEGSRETWAESVSNICSAASRSHAYGVWLEGIKRKVGQINWQIEKVRKNKKRKPIERWWDTRGKKKTGMNAIFVAQAQPCQYLLFLS